MYARQRFVWLVAGIAIGCGAMAAFVARHSWFNADDFRNLNDAQADGLSFHFLMSPVFGERFSPGHRLLDWLVLQWPGHEWTIVVIVSATCITAATALVAVFVRQVSDEPLLALLVALLFGTWVGWMRISLWWATSASTLPAIAFSVAAMVTTIRWDQHRRRVDFVATVILVIAALSCSVRAAMVPLLAFAVLTLALPVDRELKWHGFLGRLRSTAPLLVVMAAAAPAFVVLDQHAKPPGPTQSSPSFGDWASFIWHWMIDGVGSVIVNARPSAAGGPAAASLLGLALLAALAIATIRNRRSAVIWVGTLALLIACGAQVGYARLSQFGPVFVVDELRYHEGDPLVLALLIPCAWAAAGRPVPSGALQRAAAAGLGAVFAVLWIGSGISAEHQLRAHDPGTLAAATMATLRRTLPPLVVGATAPTLLDDRTPIGLSGPAVRGRWLAGTIRRFVPEVRLTTMQPDGTPIIVGDDGRAMRLVLGPERRLSGARSLCFRAAPTSHYLGPGGAGTVLPLPRSAPGNGLEVLTARFGRTTSPGRLAVIFRPSAIGLPDVVVNVNRTTTGVRVVIPAGTEAIGLAAWQGLSTCLGDTSVRAATPSP